MPVFTVAGDDARFVEDLAVVAESALGYRGVEPAARDRGCADKYHSPLMGWLNSKSTSHLAWTWNTNFNCATRPGLITSYAGKPTAFGAEYESDLRALARSPGCPRN